MTKLLALKGNRLRIRRCLPPSSTPRPKAVIVLSDNVKPVEEPSYYATVLDVGDIDKWSDVNANARSRETLVFGAVPPDVKPGQVLVFKNMGTPGKFPDGSELVSILDVIGRVENEDGTPYMNGKE